MTDVRNTGTDPDPDPTYVAVRSTVIREAIDTLHLGRMLVEDAPGTFDTVIAALGTALAVTPQRVRELNSGIRWHETAGTFQQYPTTTKLSFHPDRVWVHLDQNLGVASVHEIEGVVVSIHIGAMDSDPEPDAEPAPVRASINGVFVGGSGLLPLWRAEVPAGESHRQVLQRWMNEVWETNE